MILGDVSDVISKQVAKDYQAILKSPDDQPSSKSKTAHIAINSYQRDVLRFLRDHGPEVALIVLRNPANIPHHGQIKPADYHIPQLKRMGYIERTDQARRADSFVYRLTDTGRDYICHE